MFEIRRRYRLLLVLFLVLVLLALVYRILVQKRILPGEPLFLMTDVQSSWTTSPARPRGDGNRTGAGGTEEDIDRALRGLGYQSGYEEAPGREGVVVHRPGSAHPGLNFYVSGHGPEARLMDMEGTVVHRWRLPWHEAFSEQPAASIEDPEKARHWRKAHVYPNGDLLAIFGSHALVKIDRHSNLLWARANHAHHDVAVTRNGEIVGLRYEPVEVSTSPEERRRFSDVIRSARLGGAVPRRLDDVIQVYGPDGTFRRQYSLLRAFQRSDYHGLLGYVGFVLQEAESHLEHPEEFFHTNSIELLPDTGGPALFGEGDLLLSSKTLSAVFVMDLDREKIVWALPGMTGTQHGATLLENGHLLILDNGKLAGSSRVIEVDPRTQKVVWQYGDRDGERFYTACCGTSQRLSNGNTLITDTESGRAFEVTRDGEVVWEFVSPHRAGENDELVASLFELKRYPRAYFGDWLEEEP